nr:MAG TPA: hypothetical protein [Bacteriophage sp.]
MYYTLPTKCEVLRLVTTICICRGFGLYIGVNTLICCITII